MTWVGRHTIDTPYLRGLQVGWVTVGYRRLWRWQYVYAVRNRNEHSVYCGLGPVYLRLRWKELR